jgi:polyphosphate glucokinase
MGKKAIGVDIGGSGIKLALVDTKSGELISERIRVDTPEGAQPHDVVATVTELVGGLAGEKPTWPVGISFPAVVKRGVTKSAANVSAAWLDYKAELAFARALEREVHVVNDADAAGVAEMMYGAGRNEGGLVIMTTLGTGIGTALFYDGVLIPNSELGHLELDGHDAEKVSANSARERENLSFAEWAKRLTRYYSELERLFTPNLFIVGGGISKQHSEFLPLIDIGTPILPAELRNNAGIIGAAALARLAQH